MASNRALEAAAGSALGCPTATTPTRLSALCMAAALSMACAHAHAEDTLKKIKDTGTVTMGARESSGVLSYTLGGGKYVGFQIDLCQRVLADIQKQLGMAKLDVRYQAVTAQNRVPLVQNGTVDIECGSTANTLARQRDVAFSITTYVEEGRVAVKANSGIGSLNELANKQVITTTGTTSVQTLRKHERTQAVNFNEIFGKDHSDSFLLLEANRGDAFVMDGQILAGLIARSRNPADYKILPEVLSTEPVGLMFRKDDPGFKKAVDDSLKAMIRSGEVARFYDKWFLQPVPPANTKVGLPLSQATKAVWAEPNDKPLEDYAKKQP